jgi:hypothetical protein
LNTKSTYDSHPKPLSMPNFQFSEQEHIKTYVTPKTLLIEGVSGIWCVLVSNTKMAPQHVALLMYHCHYYVQYPCV